jgi:hypothetical protein
VLTQLSLRVEQSLVTRLQPKQETAQNNAPGIFTLVSSVPWAQGNMGEQKPEATTVSIFELPWRLAFLPDGRMLITKKVGPVWLVSQNGETIPVRPRLLAGPERHAWRLPLAKLRHQPEHLSHLRGTG